MNPVTSNLISASAGTGKTYKLSSRFISLLALGYPAERLIALTFTRNAAGEFKSNILKDLAMGAATPEGAQKLTKRILDTLNGAKEGEVPLCPQSVEGLSLGLGQEKYREMLSELIRKMPQLNLSTLDSFFSKLVGTNCLKLGYPSVEQMDEAVENKVRKAALMALILEGAEENEEGLLELFRDVSGESKSALAALEENVISYYGEYRQTKSSGVWGRLAPFDLPHAQVTEMLAKSPASSDREVLMELEQVLAEREQCIERLLEELAAQGTKFNNHVANGCKNLVSHLRQGEGELNASTAKWLYSTTASCEAEAELRRVVRETRDLAVLLPAVLKSRAIMRLLRRYDQRYQDDVQATGKLVFADMPRLVADKLLNEDDLGAPANIAYRLDGQLDHWMLDEFQDTSPEQWRALKVLLTEIRDEAGQDPVHSCAERSIFVVGDEKQSIYGWRGATPELFGYLAEGKDGWHILQGTQQNESFRSADAIMGEVREEAGTCYGFVNDLFMHIPGLSPEKRKEFTRHKIAAVNRDKVGYACVEKINPSEGEDDEAVLEQMCKRIAGVLIEEVDFAHKNLSAAILVRSNKEVHSICRWFQKNASGIKVVSLTDEPLSSASLLSEMFLHFFKWMQHPNSRFSENMVLHSSLCVKEAPGETPAQIWRRCRQLLDDKGLAYSMERLAGNQAFIRQDRAYREWMNEARAFDAKGASLDEWVLHMSSHATKTAAPMNCVHIMTFHKSKGLGYDVVFMPFSSSSAAVSSAALFYKKALHSNDSEEVLGLLVNPGVKDKGVADSPYWRLVQERMRSQVAEALNVLYVAVTRAKLANYIYINAKEKKEPKDKNSLSLSFSEMFHFAFMQRFEGEKVEWGDPKWASFAGAEKAEAPGKPEIRMPMHTYRRRVSPSKTDDHPRREGELLAAYEEAAAWSDEDSGDAAAFGTAVHALFEQVEWLGEEAPRWLTEPRSTEEQLVASALQQEDIRALFTRQPGQVAYREQAIDAIEERKGRDGVEREVWSSGILDRLVLTHRGAEVVAAEIIDFKTDIRRGDTQAEQDAHLCDTHRAQMKAYHSLIRRAMGLPAEAVTVTLISCPRDGAPARAVRCDLVG